VAEFYETCKELSIDTESVVAEQLKDTSDKNIMREPTTN